MDVVVQKYGGSSVADLPRLEGVADRIARSAGRGERVCTVVSAMGRTTDDLLALARQVTDAPPRRELDMLVSTGERIAMALLAMAIQKRGLEAISFTGSQSGIITNDRHSDAQIIEVRPVRIQDELSRGKVVIVAGFQGMSYRREITTLGRGGSDATAVALASALGASYCEICSDVDGVYTADPRRVPEAFLLEKISYEEMLELAAHGAQVLNVQAVEWARKTGVTILTSAAHREGGHSRVDTQGTGLPACGVTVAENLASLRLGGPAEELRTHLGQLGVGFRPCQGGPEAEASCVVSTAELPEWRSASRCLDPPAGFASHFPGGAIRIVGDWNRLAARGHRAGVGDGQAVGGGGSGGGNLAAADHPAGGGRAGQPPHRRPAPDLYRVPRPSPRRSSRVTVEEDPGPAAFRKLTRSSNCFRV